VGWGEVSHDRAMTSLYLWMFTSKWIKLLGHYIRYPVDVFLLPVSILFGYFHGAIKMYAVMTLNVVSVSTLFLPFSFLQFLRGSIVDNSVLFWWFLRVAGGGGTSSYTSASPSFGPEFPPPHTPTSSSALITTPPSCRCLYPPSSRASQFFFSYP
jgi:hypothetical protein